MLRRLVSCAVVLSCVVGCGDAGLIASAPTPERAVPSLAASTFTITPDSLRVGSATSIVVVPRTSAGAPLGPGVDVSVQLTGGMVSDSSPILGYVAADSSYRATFAPSGAGTTPVVVSAAIGGESLPVTRTLIVTAVPVVVVPVPVPTPPPTPTPTPTPTPPQTWTFCARVNGPWCEFAGLRDLRLVATNGSSVTQRVFRWGVCDRATFAASLPAGAIADHCDYGERKTEVLQNPLAGMAGLPAQVTVPLGDTGVTAAMTAPTGIPPASVPPEGIFRTECTFAKMGFFDPIVFPGQALAGHLHAFFGNTAVSGTSTPESVATTGNSTCLGGTLNRTAYWVPAVFDAVTGEVQTPYQGQFYYKNGILDPTTIQPIPAGLRMIAGNKNATGPQPNVQWNCQKVWNTQSAIDGMIPNCGVGDVVMLIIYFPECWDGVRLDSPDHQSHMAFAIYRNQPGQVSSCPSTHPVPLPRITEFIRYIVGPNSNPVNWRLTSDMYSGSIRGGLSAHADWMDGWSRDAMTSIVRNCINAQKDCGVGSLGNGRDLVYRSP